MNNSADKGLSVLISVYNEETSILSILKEVESVLKKLPMEYEIIAVNDGSADNTGAQRQNCSIAGLNVLKHEQNKGYGAPSNN